MKLFVACLLVALVAQNAQARVFSRCELARELLRHGFSRGDLDNWVCLVESESSRNTGVVGPQNTDGSFDYGLFQINDRYWCKPGYNGGECNMNCHNLLNDDISDDAKCVRHIFSVHSWTAWYGWIRRCQGQPIANIQQECGF